MTNSIDALLDPPSLEKEFLPEEAVEHAKKVIEALLFATNVPLPLERIREILSSFYEFKPIEVVTVIHELQKEYQEEGRAFHLEEIAEGYLLRTSPDYAPYIQELFRNRKAERLSHAAREVLSIIAFKQPITRAGIESIRGVDSSSIVQTLSEKDLVEAVGQHDSPGKPTLFGTTSTFLRHFGLRDVDQLRELLGVPAEAPLEVAEENPQQEAETPEEEVEALNETDAEALEEETEAPEEAEIEASVSEEELSEAVELVLAEEHCFNPESEV